MKNNKNEIQEWKNEALIVWPGLGKQYSSNGTILEIMVSTKTTNNQFGLYNVFMEPKSQGPKLHYHRNMDETFIIKEGTLTVLTADGETEAKAGSVIYIPRFTAHGYCNRSEFPIKMIMLFNPGHNREDFFRELYKTLEEKPNDTETFLKLYSKYDSIPLNPEDMIPLINSSKDS